MYNLPTEIIAFLHCFSSSAILQISNSFLCLSRILIVEPGPFCCLLELCTFVIIAQISLWCWLQVVWAVWTWIPFLMFGRSLGFVQDWWWKLDCLSCCMLVKKVQNSLLAALVFSCITVLTLVRHPAPLTVTLQSETIAVTAMDLFQADILVGHCRKSQV